MIEPRAVLISLDALPKHPTLFEWLLAEHSFAMSGCLAATFSNRIEWRGKTYRPCCGGNVEVFE